MKLIGPDQLVTIEGGLYLTTCDRSALLHLPLGVRQVLPHSTWRCAFIIW